MLPGLPDDACPYPRPFRADFDDCDTFQGQSYVPLSSRFEVLPAVITCQFLTEGQAAPGRFYARCRLGTAVERLDWLGRMDRERLSRLKRLREELRAALAGQPEKLWALKGQQLAALQAGEPDAERAATEALAVVADEMETTLDRFLRDRQPLMRQLGLPIAETKRLVRELLQQMIVRQTASSPLTSVSPELLREFPPEVRAIFEPSDASAAGSSGH